jgi:hypothetical protein
MTKEEHARYNRGNHENLNKIMVQTKYIQI